MRSACCVRLIVLLLLVASHWLNAFAAEENTVDVLLSECAHYLNSTPESARFPLEKLHALRSTFTQIQNEKYHNFLAASFAARGMHEERVAVAESYLGEVKSPPTRARFLYHLIDGNASLGHYGKALLAMNEAVQLVPILDDAQSKIIVLQGALALSNSLHAFDDALEYAQRIYALRDDNVGSLAACMGLTDIVEINFLKGDRQTAQSLVQEAIRACDANKNQLFTLIVKTDVAIDLIDSGQYTTGIDRGLPLLREFSILSQDADYVTQLEEALARAYLKANIMDRAEYYGKRAFARAQTAKVLELQEKTSETMAAIKRAQGQLAAAVGFYEVNLALKKKVLDDQLHKNLAYQRVKFDTQDKANQMALLEQKNKTLSVERALQQGRYQNLILLMTLVLVVLAILGAWLVNTLRLKNVFRKSAQIDGLTQVSNRAHFTGCAQQLFKDAQSIVSIVLFDMDFFKKINDTYGHAAGDWVLEAVCAIAKAQLQKGDCIGRLGGEEFAICLKDSSEGHASAMAERCRAAIAEIDTQPCGFDFLITASFGVATRSRGQSASFEEILVAADKALYLAKNEGRNRVTVAKN